MVVYELNGQFRNQDKLSANKIGFLVIPHLSNFGWNVSDLRNSNMLIVQISHKIPFHCDFWKYNLRVLSNYCHSMVLYWLWKLTVCQWVDVNWIVWIVAQMEVVIMHSEHFSDYFLCGLYLYFPEDADVTRKTSLSDIMVNEVSAHWLVKNILLTCSLHWWTFTNFPIVYLN